MRKWQVKKDGKAYFGTDCDECMYSVEEMKKIVKAGFKIYKEGKIYSLKKAQANPIKKKIKTTPSKKKG